jgi:hypothetical protein
VLLTVSQVAALLALAAPMPLVTAHIRTASAAASYRRLLRVARDKSAVCVANVLLTVPQVARDKSGVTADVLQGLYSLLSALPPEIDAEGGGTGAYM